MYMNNLQHFQFIIFWHLWGLQQCYWPPLGGDIHQQCPVFTEILDVFLFFTVKYSHIIYYIWIFFNVICFLKIIINTIYFHVAPEYHFVHKISGLAHQTHTSHRQTYTRAFYTHTQASLILCLVLQTPLPDHRAQTHICLSCLNTL